MVGVLASIAWFSDVESVLQMPNKSQSAVVTVPTLCWFRLQLPVEAVCYLRDAGACSFKNHCVMFLSGVGFRVILTS